MRACARQCDLLAASLSPLVYQHIMPTCPPLSVCPGGRLLRRGRAQWAICATQCLQRLIVGSEPSPSWRAKASARHSHAHATNGALSRTPAVLASACVAPSSEVKSCFTLFATNLFW